MDTTENGSGAEDSLYFDGKVCRACLETQGNMSNVFGEAVNGVYVSVTSIEASESDGLPPWICAGCLRQLNKFNYFRERCRSVRYTLDAFINKQRYYQSRRLTKEFLVSERKRLNVVHTLSYSNTLAIDVTSSPTQDQDPAGHISVYTASPTCVQYKEKCDTDRRFAIESCDKTSHVTDDVKNEEWDSGDRYEDGVVSEEDKEKIDGVDLYAVKLEELDDLGYENLPLKIVKQGVVDDDCFSGNNYGGADSFKTKKPSKRKLKRSKIDSLEDYLVEGKEGKRNKKKKDRKKDKKREKLKLKVDVMAVVKEEVADKSLDRPEISSRMVLETEQYKVIKLSKEQLTMEMIVAAKSERYLNAPFKCEMCVKGFNYEDVLQNHMSKHSPKNGELECDLCHQFLPSTVSMRGHKKSHSTKYQCKRCLVVKASRQHLLEHYTLLHEGTPRTYICNVCGKTLTKRTMFQKHMRIHYPSTKIACDKCGKLFKTIETLRAHMLRHADVKRYACDQCPKAFRYASLLYTHKVTHITTKDYYCVECDMKFKTQSNLKLHLRKSLKHIDPDMLRFGCSHCSRRYDDEKGLRHHIEWVHLRLKNFKCAKCEMQFGSQDGLRSHMKKIHDGVRPARTHTCDICNKAFRAKAVLVKHIRVHTGERPFECGECGKKFAQNSTMATHIKLVHLKMRRHVGARRLKTEQTQPQPPVLLGQFLYEHGSENNT